MEAQVFNYNGNNITFQLGNGDVMVNATEMAKSFNKLPADWTRLKSSRDFLSSLSAVKHIHITGLIKVVQGGNTKQGTWMHEDVAIEFSRWLSPAFAIWCNDRIKELIKHGVTATDQKLEEIASNPDLLIELANNLKKERAEKLILQEKNKLQQAELKKQAPKVAYVEEVLQSNSTYVVNQIAKELGMSAITLNRKLKQLRVIYSQNGSYLLYSKYQNKGYTKTKTYTYTDSLGEQKTSMQLVWTEKGRAFIHQLINQ